MNIDLNTVFNGFLHLPNLDKLKLVEMINEYFDSNDKESIRELHDLRFAEIAKSADARDKCVCCGN